jgi:hypothetical protein
MIKLGSESKELPYGRPKRRPDIRERFLNYHCLSLCMYQLIKAGERGKFWNGSIIVCVGEWGLIFSVYIRQ